MRTQDYSELCATCRAPASDHCLRCSAPVCDAHNAPEPPDENERRCSLCETAFAVVEQDILNKPKPRLLLLLVLIGLVLLLAPAVWVANLLPIGWAGAMLAIHALLIAVPGVFVLPKPIDANKRIRRARRRFLKQRLRPELPGRKAKRLIG